MRPTTFYIPNSAVSTTNPTTPTSAIINRFDEVLSPIDEREGSESDLVRKNLRKIVLNEIVDDSLAGSDEHAIRKSSDSCLHAHHQLLRSASAKRLLRRFFAFFSRKLDFVKFSTKKNVSENYFFSKKIERYMFFCNISF